MIALIAGRGDLPGVLVAALGARPMRICALEGFAPDAVTPAQTFRIEHLGSFIQSLVADGVTQVCFAGAMARPPIDATQIDPATMPLVPRMVQALQAGDDGALRTVIAFFEEAGLEVVAAHDLAPDLMPKPGVLTGAPSDQDRADLVRARAVHGAMASVDVGQACVVARGQVLAVEALPGTDWMLKSLIAPKTPAAVAKTDPGDPLEWAFGGVSDWLSGPDAPVAREAPVDFARPPGGVFYKASKPGQDLRIDMPVIGPETVRGVARAGLNGLVLEAGRVMVLNMKDVLQAADSAGVFLWVAEA